MSWADTQLVYHALARQNEECLILTSTKEPYTCIGFAQDLQKELDIEYCKDHGIPYFRRETGGGTVYLDKNQLFYQLIIHRDNPETPWHNEGFFRKFLNPVVKTLINLGMNAKFVPINDLIVDGKKISGNGGGEIGECKVLIGNLLLDFDFNRMAAILNVPNEEFRKRIYNSMLANLTTIKAELGSIPTNKKLRNMLKSEYEKLLGPLSASELDKNVYTLMSELGEKFSTEKWLFQRVPKVIGREVKIREGLLLVYKNYQINDQEIELMFEVEEEKIKDVKLINSSKMNKLSANINKLIGTSYNDKEILNIINDLCEPNTPS
jgi:lipoate-protein ligase A